MEKREKSISLSIAIGLWCLKIKSNNPRNLRLCRLMCGKSLTFRYLISFFAAPPTSLPHSICLENWRHSRRVSRRNRRKGRAFPHIGGHSPKEFLLLDWTFKEHMPNGN
jgi:hypothetical protein